jgi:pantoate--beta-alanine ligase
MRAVVETVAEVRSAVRGARAAGRVVGLLPTLGALHEGHLSIIRRASAGCGYVVVSVFVNPTQFAPGSDFEKYPRDLTGDARRAMETGADLIFAPPLEEMYPSGDATFVEVTEVTSGGSRPCARASSTSSGPTGPTSVRRTTSSFSS